MCVSAAVRIICPQKEYELLVQLAREPERVFTKEELLVPGVGLPCARAVPGPSTRMPRASAASSARRQQERPLIENVWGVGYSLLGELPEM